MAITDTSSSTLDTVYTSNVLECEDGPYPDSIKVTWDDSTSSLYTSPRAATNLVVSTGPEWQCTTTGTSEILITDSTADFTNQWTGNVQFEIHVPVERYGSTPAQAKIETPVERAVRRLKKQRDLTGRRARARQMLKAVLQPDQWKEYMRYGSVRYVGKRGVYELGAGKVGWGREVAEWGRRGERWQGGVYVLDFQGNATKKLCVHISAEYCEEDRILANLLALMTDEKGFLEIAIEHMFEPYERERVQARRAFKPRRIAA